MKKSELRQIIREEISNQLNEDVFGTIAAVIGGMSFGVLGIALMHGPGAFDEMGGGFIKQWRNDRIVKKIIERLQKDKEILAFFNQPKSKQTGWTDLLKSKLKSGEEKYLRALHKSKINNQA